MTDFIPILLSSIAIILTIINFWYSFYRKKPLRFVCSSFTGLGMEMQPENKIGSSFAIKLDIINEGSVPQVLTDLIVKANYEGEKESFNYEPIVLWNFTEQIRSNGQKTVGNSQNGQVNLPKLINPKSYFSFEHHILFLPINKKTLITPNKNKNIYIRVYALTQGNKNYKLIGSQQFKSEDLKELRNGSFSSVISDESKLHRNKLITPTANSDSGGTTPNPRNVVMH